MLAAPARPTTAVGVVAVGPLEPSHEPVLPRCSTKSSRTVSHLMRMSEPIDWDERAKAIAAELDGSPWDSHAVKAIVEATLREEMAEAMGIDPAAAEAMSLIREFGGHRRALRYLNDPAVLSFITTQEGVEYHARLTRWVEEYRSQLPKWRRTLGG